MRRTLLKRIILCALALAVVMSVSTVQVLAQQSPAGSSVSDTPDDIDLLDDDLLLGEDEGPPPKRIADPLRPFNMLMFEVNDRLYFWVLKPLATGYKKVTPQPVRSGIKNFFRNLTTPIRFANCLLQGNPVKASKELARFMVNTTVGVLGFGDPAQKDPRLARPSPEDFGQTLAVYGIGDGFYLVLPIIGPTTLRDAFGISVDMMADPVSYVDPSEASIGVSMFNNLNDMSFRLGDYETMKDAALNPYSAVKNAFIQNRHKNIEE